ncbi:MAG: hypothetical protein ACRDHE_18130 [Ktedonobacterales bacterium]
MARNHHPKRPPDIPGLLGTLDRHGARYVLTGSVAALAYGVEIGQAGDLDITPALNVENLTRLSAVLDEIEAGLDPDAPFGHWETRADGEKHWRVDEATPELQAERANWRVDPADPSTFDTLVCSRLGNFDIVPELSGPYEALMKRAVPLRAWGYAIWVVHVDELLAALTVPRRPKDTPRVRQLRELQRQRGEHQRLEAEIEREPS